MSTLRKDGGIPHPCVCFLFFSSGPFVLGLVSGPKKFPLKPLSLLCRTRLFSVHLISVACPKEVKSLDGTSLLSRIDASISFLIIGKKNLGANNLCPNASW